MYDYSSTVAYPLVNLDGVSADQAAALKKGIIDFGLQIYATSISVPVNSVVVEINQLVQSGNNLVITFNFSANGLTVLSTPMLLSIPSAAGIIQIHFDSTDMALLPGYSVEGFIVIKDLADWLIKFATPFIGSLKLEPGTTTVFSGYRVNSITCVNSKPLLLQTNDSKYYDPLQPVTGDVKFKPGANCSIAVSEAETAINISTQLLANGTEDELCGVWRDAISEADTLCSNVIFTIAGVGPDTNGNVTISAVGPLGAHSLSGDELPEGFSSVLSGFSHINKFIYIGLPRNIDGTPGTCEGGTP